ncbi:MAG: sporulation protein YqfD [Clostridia bacterium]|nr:sporulation protein YqfD [Clostridia bacterium]
MGGWTRLRIEGLNIDRQFDKMIKSGITAKDIKRRDKKCIEFCLPANQTKQGIDFFASECYNVLTIDNAPVCSFLHFCKTRFVFVLCFVSMIASLFLLGGRIWRVDISGDINPALVQKVLQDNGLWIGTRKDDVVLDVAENVLCNNLPDTKYAIVSLKGSTLFVETFKKELPQQIVGDDGKNLYATQDGVISRIVLVRGTAKVSVGDVVTKGQLLVEGVRTHADGATEQVRAVAQVFADVTYTGVAKFDGWVTTLVKTGKSRAVVDLSLFGFDTNKNKNIYKKQIEQSYTQTFFPLPVKITKTVVFQAVEQKQKVDFDEQKYKQIALDDALLKVDGVVSDVQYVINPVDGGMVVCANVKVQKQIDTY